MNKRIKEQGRKSERETGQLYYTKNVDSNINRKKYILTNLKKYIL